MSTNTVEAGIAGLHKEDCWVAPEESMSIDQEHKVCRRIVQAVINGLEDADFMILGPEETRRYWSER